jgi:hypothetical protein
MGRRKSKLSTLSIFRWFCRNVAIMLGIVPPSRRSRRVFTKRCNRRIVQSNKNIKRQKCFQSNEIDMYQDINSRTDVRFHEVDRQRGIPLVRYSISLNFERVGSVLFPNSYQYLIILIIIEHMVI